MNVKDDILSFTLFTVTHTPPPPGIFRGLRHRLQGIVIRQMNDLVPTRVIPNTRFGSKRVRNVQQISTKALGVGSTHQRWSPTY